MFKKILSLMFIFLAMTSMAFADDVENAEAQASSMIESVIGTIGKIFDEIYTVFNEQFNLSIANLQMGFIPKLVMALITLEILWLGTQAILQKEMAVSEIFVKFFLICLIVVIITNLQELIYGVRYIFSLAGIKAGDLDPGMYSNSHTVSLTGQSLGYGIRPSLVSYATIESFKPLQNIINIIHSYLDSVNVGLLGIGNSVTGIGYLSIAFPCYLAIISCYIVEFILLVLLLFVNMSVMLWFVEFGFLLVVALICLPWQIFAPTKFMAQGLWQTLFGQCIKIFCVLFLVGIAAPLFDVVAENSFGPVRDSLEDVARTKSGAIDTEKFVFPAGAVLQGILTTICIVLTYGYLLMKGPSMAFAVLSGTPTMETLGTHAVTRMGARAAGAAWGGIVAGAGALMGVAGASFGKILGGTGRRIHEKWEELKDIFSKKDIKSDSKVNPDKL